MVVAPLLCAWDNGESSTGRRTSTLGRGRGHFRIERPKLLPCHSQEGRE
jgi:hypothetical protein